ncbi:MAG: Mov34/MPN/PAD-1 family protein [Polyangiaceae bacterium]|nr:Mov34/MPN/PAD-1 family protein [Polyangiaceae bacterium]
MVTNATPAWARGEVAISRAALSALEADVKARYLTGEEACGYIVGPADPAPLCDQLVAIENLANKLHKLDPETYFRDARTFFAFNEKKFDDAVRKGAALERPVKILYHSHLDTGAYFSATDASVLSFGEPPATEGGPCRLGPGPQWPLAFLVTSVYGGEAGPRIEEHRMYVWEGRSFVEAPFTVVD